MREKEIRHAKFFIDWINKTKNLDFTLSSEEIPEKSDIDIIAISNSLNKKIFIQHTSFRGEGLIYAKNTLTSVKINGEDVDPSLFPLFSDLNLVLSPVQKNKSESLIGYIKKKENMYPENQKKELVLIVDITLPSIFPEELNKIFSENFETSFWGVYVVQLPIPISSGNKWEVNGFVYPIKDFDLKQ